MTIASSAKAASTPHIPDTAPATARIERLPGAVGCDAQAERRAPAGVVDKVDDPVHGGGLRQAEREAEHRHRDHHRREVAAHRENEQTARGDDRRHHGEFQVGDPPDEERGRAPREQRATGADAQQNADLRGCQPDRHAQQRQIDQEEVDAALRGEAGHQRRRHPSSAQQTPHPFGLALAHRRHLDAGAHRENGGGHAGDERPCRDQ